MVCVFLEHTVFDVYIQLTDARRSPFKAFEDTRKTEIAKDNVPIVEKNVIRFDVSVNDVMTVQYAQGLNLLICEVSMGGSNF